MFSVTKLTQVFLLNWPYTLIMATDCKIVNFSCNFWFIHVHVWYAYTLVQVPSGDTNFDQPVTLTLWPMITFPGAFSCTKNFFMKFSVWKVCLPGRTRKNTECIELNPVEKDKPSQEIDCWFLTVYKKNHGCMDLFYIELDSFH